VRPKFTAFLIAFFRLEPILEVDEVEFLIHRRPEAFRSQWKELQPDKPREVVQVNVVLTENRSSKGSRSIMAQIKRSIEAGTLVNGDQLPPERELSDSYSASRSTIRKALNELEKLGLVARKVGSGTFVTYSGPAEIDVENVIDQISPLQLIEARVGFERQMARLAVVHATGRDIERMETILAELETCENDKDQFTRADSEFHLTLAKASGNPLMVQLYDQINEVRAHSQWKAARELVLSPQKINQYNRHHRKMFEGLRNRDATTIIEALNAHMDLAHKDLMGAPALD